MRCRGTHQQVNRPLAPQTSLRDGPRADRHRGLKAPATFKHRSAMDSFSCPSALLRLSEAKNLRDDAAEVPMAADSYKGAELCFSSPASRQTPEEIRGSSFLRMTGTGHPPDRTGSPWRSESLRVPLREAHPLRSPHILLCASAVLASWLRLRHAGRLRSNSYSTPACGIDPPKISRNNSCCPTNTR